MRLILDLIASLDAYLDKKYIRPNTPNENASSFSSNFQSVPYIGEAIADGVIKVVATVQPTVTFITDGVQSYMTNAGLTKEKVESAKDFHETLLAFRALLDGRKADKPNEFKKQLQDFVKAELKKKPSANANRLFNDVELRLSTDLLDANVDVNLKFSEQYFIQLLCDWVKQEQDKITQIEKDHYVERGLQGTYDAILSLFKNILDEFNAFPASYIQYNNADVTNLDRPNPAAVFIRTAMEMYLKLRIEYWDYRLDTLSQPSPSRALIQRALSAAGTVQVIVTGDRKTAVEKLSKIIQDNLAMVTETGFCRTTKGLNLVLKSILYDITRVEEDTGASLQEEAHILRVALVSINNMKVINEELPVASVRSVAVTPLAAAANSSGMDIKTPMDMAANNGSGAGLFLSSVGRKATGVATAAASAAEGSKTAVNVIKSGAATSAAAKSSNQALASPSGHYPSTEGQASILAPAGASKATNSPQIEGETAKAAAVSTPAASTQPETSTIVVGCQDSSITAVQGLNTTNADEFESTAQAAGSKPKH